MINYNPKEWFTFIFRVHKSDTVRQLMPMIISLSIYVALVAFLEIEVFNLGENSHLKNITILHGMLGFVISLLLVFRTNTAYERWWEGRKLWGSLTNTSRNLAMKINAILPKDNEADRTFFREHIVEYAFALKRHLRGHQRDSEVFQSNVIIDHELHKPNHIAALMYTRLNDLYNQKVISGTQLLFLNEEFRAFTDICGACERIKNTPIPFSYSVFIKKFIFFYVMSLPFGYVFSLGYIAVPIVVFVFYVLASLEIIAEEIENPFGVDDNDLPLTMMSKNIQKHVGEIL
ncbi:bestrophin family ion channel [Arcicella sp. DC2W]|uniref:Bestrophin family ion channel n=1 Tax=Arcicella gelida TaxID=2984195 RepID=A0ABU5SA62_9BACT|nr:bestrophin family ion channel [Arcicella sp. DC2W]MEA5405093.1 bestrophin family ion channel [Arcicella sp. DC2W]